MKPGSVVAGIIVFLLGLAGLLEIYGRPVLPFSLAVVSSYLGGFGTLVLFTVITIVGLALIVTGLVTSEPRAPERKEEVLVVHRAVLEPVVERTVVKSGGTVVEYATLSDLELTILRHLSQGKKPDEIAKITGVSGQTIKEKETKLRAEGYITEKNALTEKGYDTLRRAES